MYNVEQVIDQVLERHLTTLQAEATHLPTLTAEGNVIPSDAISRISESLSALVAKDIVPVTSVKESVDFWDRRDGRKMEITSSQVMAKVMIFRTEEDLAAFKADLLECMTELLEASRS